MQHLNWLRRNEATTTYMVWLAALVALLAAETGQSDIVIGTYVTTRRGAELQKMMGDFTNLAELRFHCDHVMSFRDWLSEVRFWVTAAEARSEISHEELRKELHQLGVTLPEVQVIFGAPMGYARMDRHFAGLRLTLPESAPVAVMPWGFSMFLVETNGQQRVRGDL